MAFGVTPQGFNRKRLDEIKAELEQAFRGVFGVEVNLDPEEVFGQLIGIVSERENELWELSEAVYDSQYPDSSEDVNLDNVSSITASVRGKPLFSIITGQLFFGDPLTVIDTNKVVSVFGNSLARFKPLQTVTLVAGLNAIQKITFDADPDGGDFDFTFRFITVNIAHDDSISAINTALDTAFGVGNIVASGAIDDSTGLSFEFKNPGALGFGLRPLELAVIENNVLLISATPVIATIATTQIGVPQGQADMQAELTGPTDAPSGALTEIETAVTGWDSTVNPLDAVQGQNVESDPEFKIRRKNEVANPGQATPPGIFSDLINVDGVTDVIVFQNNLDIPDLDGRPPHSVDIVIEGGDEDELGDEVFKTVGGGITFVGDITKVVKDSNDFDQTVKFSRPSDIPIFVEIDLITDPDLFPVDGLAQVTNAVLAYGDVLTIGQDVVVFGSDPNLSCSFQDVPGITDYTIRVGKSASPSTDDNVVIEPREKAQFDSSRIDVTKV